MSAISSANEYEPRPRAVAPTPFSCTAHHVTQGVVRLAVAGELDIATVGEFDQALRGAEGDGGLVVLDLRALEFIDSASVCVLLAATRRIGAAGGKLVVARAPAQAARLLGLTGGDRELRLVAPAARPIPAAADSVG